MSHVRASGSTKAKRGLTSEIKHVFVSLILRKKEYWQERLEHGWKSRMNRTLQRNHRLGVNPMVFRRRQQALHNP